MKIGRNDPCPCGSGKKYKKCCMNEETAKRPRSISDSDRSSDAWNGAEMEFAMLQAEDMIPFGKQRTARERIMALEDILVGCPDYYPAGFELGARLIMTGDPERYEKIIDRALEVMKERGEKPGDISKAIEFVCEVLEKYFRYSDAIRYYEQLADIETEDRWRASAHSDISNCCFYLDDSERALREAEEAVAITPNSCKQLSNLGWI
ncbi:MAG: SEC-C metal-binding domain-containing protein, partial [Candidatus Thermoplasmatota archaeon]|nr:SEC-C metal-binding domain-containing protein [Candidatus Thermoplasmatota archaeon]